MPYDPSQPEPQREVDVTTCLNCHSPMPAGLRFCRTCGFRLGEGVAEYTETARFDGVKSGAAGNLRVPMPGQAPVTTYGLSGGIVPPVSSQLKRRKKISGMTWIFLGLLVFFISAAAFTAVVSPLRRGTGMGRISIAKVPPRSYFGTNTFETAEGGVTFTHVVPPGSPADKAGMVGGDIITSFDGKPVKEDDELREVLADTPVGKTVEVIYLRDGDTRTTQLTTISKEEFDRLDTAFDQRPEGRGRFGYNDDNSERVPIPGTRLFGVRLNDIDQSLPADMAGIKEGDVVIEFGGVPIRTPEELSWRVRRAIPYETVKVVLMRNGEKLEIPVKMGKQ